MSQNPYMYSGFADGFTRGFELVSNEKDRRKQRELQARGLELQEGADQRAAESHTQEKTYRGLQITKMQKEASPEGQKRDEEMRLLDMEGKRANIRQSDAGVALSNQNVRVSKQEQKDKDDYKKTVKTLSSVEQAQSVLGSLGKNLSPQLVQDGLDFVGLAEALQAGDVSKINPKSYQSAIRWLNSSHEGLINSGVGKTIDADTAQQHGIPIGSKILGAKLMNINMDEEGNSIMQLSMRVKSPTGEEFTYEPPVTEDRESGPDSAIRVVPAEKLLEIAKGVKYITSDIMRGLEQGMTMEQMAAELTNTAASYGKPKDPNKGPRTTMTPGEKARIYSEAWTVEKENTKPKETPSFKNAMKTAEEIVAKAEGRSGKASTGNEPTEDDIIAGVESGQITAEEAKEIGRELGYID